MRSVARLFCVVVSLFLGNAVLRGADETKGPQAPTELRCEYLVNPLGVDTLKPRFSWVLEHSERGQSQSSYEILVSTQPNADVGDLWASGKVGSADSTQVVYAGQALQSSSTYYWKIRYWDREGRQSLFSQVARFDTGLLSRDDWKGKWTGGKNQLRKEFELKKNAVRARAYVCGLGYSELRLNGHKVGRNVLDPAWTTYDERALYVTYDITGYLQPGSNAVAVMLGQGWFKANVLLIQTVRDLRYAAGSTRTVRGEVSSSWSRDERSMRLGVVIPVGSEAEVVIPRFNLEDVVIREGDQVVWDGQGYKAGVQGIRGVEKTPTGFLIKIGSGRYAFNLLGD